MTNARKTRKLGSDRSIQSDAHDIASLPPAVRDHLGAQLQAAYEALTRAHLPQHLLDLIARLDTVLCDHGRESAATFREGLVEALPGLRAFALSLIPDTTRADDLVQETVLKAWAK